MWQVVHEAVAWRACSKTSVRAGRSSEPIRMSSVRVTVNESESTSSLAWQLTQSSATGESWWQDRQSWSRVTFTVP
jgi:hypothetical protein